MSIDNDSGCFFIVLIIILLLSGIIGGWCWPYTINTWLVFLHHPPKLTYWQGFALGYVPFLGQVSIPAAVITWILMLFIG